MGSVWGRRDHSQMNADGKAEDRGTHFSSYSWIFLHLRSSASAEEGLSPAPISSLNRIGVSRPRGITAGSGPGGTRQSCYLSTRLVYYSRVIRCKIQRRPIA